MGKNERDFERLSEVRFSHSAENCQLNPKQYPSYIDLSGELPQGLADLVEGFDRCLVPGWSAMAALHSDESIAMVYSNPLHTKWQDVTPHFTDFIAPVYLSSPSLGELHTSFIDLFLQDTNYVCMDPEVEYNRVVKTETKGLVRKQTINKELFQTGIAAIVFDLVPIDEKISELCEAIKTQGYGLWAYLDNRDAELRCANEEIIKLLAQKVTHPIPLFKPAQEVSPREA